MNSVTTFIRNLTRGRLFWPVAALVALLIFNVIVTPTFFSLYVRDGHLFGSIIDIMRNGAPTMLVALGMTLVIATRGIDLSVGATAAISGALACTIIRDSGNGQDLGIVLTAIAISIGFSLVLGAWNGLLIAALGIQPIVATLILMTAGRGIAMLITEGNILTITSAPFKTLGSGHWFGLPAAVIITAGMVIIAALLTRRTALGLLIESVGVNPAASRLAGVRSRGIVWAAYVFSGLCAGIAGLIISSNVTAADANSAGLWIELDAILAVVIGGTSLMGGRYSITGTIVGAFIIQTLTTTVYTAGIPKEISLVFKAIVVILVCLLQSPVVQDWIHRRQRPLTPSTISSTPTVTPTGAPLA